MPPDFPRRLFVTGTDTGIGKTVVCAILVAGLRASYWKPVQSGSEADSDTQWIRKATGLPEAHFLPETYRFQAPLSPHAAAAREKRVIDLEAFQVPPHSPDRPLIIEGAGGVMVPLNEKHLMTDLMKRLGAPVLVVAGSGLGTINHTLLSLEKLRHDGIDVLGVVVNGSANPENCQAIAHYGQVRVCARIEPMPALNNQALTDEFVKFQL
ncbi:MAG: dethiobiotin synthase [Deltaproteobacteria bacterium]|nr:dethiobiotin synthase [Deltaproteobacteria bacterium]